MTIAIKRFLPRRMKIVALRGYYVSLDALDFLLSRRDKGTPSRSRAFSVGALRYNRAGNWFFQRFLDLGELKSNERVLDVGCGIGRMAMPLTNYLNGGGKYEGFDVVPQNIRWCQENITASYPNFRFQLADVYNKEYNPKGTHRASEYTFPYKDESFDFVISTSVFTHMLPEEVSNYISEIDRVMKGGGRAMITFFLLNQESLKLIESGMSNIDFRYDFGVYRTKEKGIPEAAVAYREDYVRNLYSENGLEIVEPIHYGRWCGRKDFLRYQDIVMTRKPTALRTQTSSL
jgi:SAM-dependent methyltransferase